MSSAATMLGIVAQAAADTAAGPSALLFIVLGLVAAALVMFFGHSVWVWRRSRGPLRSADDVVQHLADGEVHEPGLKERLEDVRRDRSA